jgi:hypothetical protein
MAAPPSSYIPPPEEFVGLAIALVEAHAQAGESEPPPA